MKKQDSEGIGCSLIVTLTFVVIEIILFQMSSSGNLILLFPIFGIGYGLYLTIKAYLKQSYREASEAIQNSKANSIKYDSTFGKEELKLYFDNENKRITIIATNGYISDQKEVEEFVRYQEVETDDYIVALDASINKVVRVRYYDTSVDLMEYQLNEKIKSLGIVLKKSSPALMTFNKYAFITDDINKFVAIVTPDNIYVHRYSDIVSISYEENGNNVFNKSLGGAVVGGILFGGPGAIVGGTTAKSTQNKEIKQMAIKILLKSTSNPTLILSIYEIIKDGPLIQTKHYADRVHYEGLMKEAEGIKDIFSIILDIEDKDLSSQQRSSIVQQTESYSIANEIAKLAKLKEQGVLTDEEFENQKKKILNS